MKSGKTHDVRREDTGLRKVVECPKKRWCPLEKGKACGCSQETEERGAVSCRNVWSARGLRILGEGKE